LPNGTCFEIYVDDAPTNITGYADSVYHEWLYNKANRRTSKIRTGYTRKVEAVWYERRRVDGTDPGDGAHPVRPALAVEPPVPGRPAAVITGRKRRREI